MDEKFIRQNAMHLRLEVLYVSLKRSGEKEASIHLDPNTWRDIKHSKLANIDRSIQFGEFKWRNIPVTLHVGMNNNFIKYNKIPEYEKIKDFNLGMFCMYIEVIKQNKRRFYIDDKQTNKQFL